GLLAYDRERHADLVRTLGAYLDHGGNYDDTAAALHIHRSTLRYRLQRIRELSGHDLTHPDTRLNLHVAVRAAVVAEPPVLPDGDHLPSL
ncbi:MAG TPA: helix-turn-helix domain-containing protein, partial [Actinomycetospora sp.]|uniref:PucR family transcriptional regulator n=1 Tax=Actinomycetospora sp. TaxID=1872135 RepID=UPI002F406C51